jgi:hypothetical protein
MNIIYRISDGGYAKNKPDYINNENCLANASRVFQHCNWLVIADAVCEDTFNMIKKYQSNIIQTHIGHGAGTFNIALDIATKLHPEEITYFLENDYLHKPNSQQIIEDAFNIKNCEYVMIYDHPDKYHSAKNGGNPYIDDDNSEYAKIYLGKFCHYKTCYSCTMTFASKAKSLIKDKEIFMKYTNDIHPYDFYLFNELTRSKNRKLLCSIPGFATHGETEYLCPLTDWSNI